ncbi:MAG: NAD(P)H-quinone oxidoreductase subunit L [Synechococcaceae cyanobacterium]|nr:NAD(P)H-quinone oxidoreductase subunit L [Synechococcaceae cyanobacterium]
MPPGAILDFGSFVDCAVDLPGALLSIPTETLLVLAAYGALAGAYLVAIPLLLYLWMVRRWMVMGKLERTGVYGLVFLFFPGLILFAPFINLRMAGQGSQRA